MIQGLISVGFGNSSGKMSTVILQENFQKVERFGIKVQINLPKLKSKTNGQLDLSHFNTMMAQRRNEAVFKSFLRNEDDDEIFNLHDAQDYAQQQIQSLVQELNTINVLKQQLKTHKFMDQTNENDAVAREYLAQFNNDLTKALQTYKQRKEIVKKFADKNKMPEYQAMSILKENGYNAALFEY